MVPFAVRITHNEDLIGSCLSGVEDLNRRLALNAGYALVTAALLFIGTAGAGFAAPAAVPVSPDPSVYGKNGCLALDKQGSSKNYLHSEVEPWVTVDPNNSSHLVGAWQQDRWSDGGAHGLVASYSTQGGASGSWNVSPQPFSVCWHASGYTNADNWLNYQRASDPWVSIGPGAPGNQGGNTVYSVSLSFDQTPFGADVNAVDNAVGAAVSYDNGAFWSHVQTIIADPCVQGAFGSPGYVCNSAKAYVFNDKESVTADPNRPGVAYAVWDRLVAPPANPSTGFQHERAYFGQTFISTTTDFGAHWSQARPLFGLASQDQTIGNQIVINRQDDTLYDFFNLIQNASNTGGNRGYNVAYSKSTDGGSTWTAPVVVNHLESAGIKDPANYNPYTNAPPAPSRTGDIIPEPGINPNNGQLYVVWQDSRFNSFSNDEVVISTSSDGGVNWSAPERVNAHTAEPAYNPAIFVDLVGTVGVTYDQWQSNALGNEATDLFIRKSTSAGSSSAGPTFADPVVVDGPFNNLAAPVSRGYFLGDYQGLTVGSGGWTAFDVKTNCSDGNSSTQPSCRAIQSVLPPTSRTPTDNNSTDVYAYPGS